VAPLFYLYVLDRWLTIQTQYSNSVYKLGGTAANGNIGKVQPGPFFSLCQIPWLFPIRSSYVYGPHSISDTNTNTAYAISDILNGKLTMLELLNIY